MAEPAGRQRPKARTGKSYRALGEINKMNQLYDGKRGFLVSCRMRRAREGRKEITDLYARYVTEAASDEPAPAGASFDEQLARELCAERERTFAHETGVECLLFCESAGDVLAEVDLLFVNARADGCVVREISRVVPMEEVGIASGQDRVVAAVERVLARHDLSGYKTFAVRYECRNNSSFTRDAVVPAVAALVPKHLKADLKHAEVEVGVEIFGRGFGVRVAAGLQAQAARWSLPRFLGQP